MQCDRSANDWRDVNRSQGILPCAQRFVVQIILQPRAGWHDLKASGQNQGLAWPFAWPLPVGTVRPFKSGTGRIKMQLPASGLRAAPGRHAGWHAATGLAAPDHQTTHHARAWRAVWRG